MEPAYLTTKGGPESSDYSTSNPNAKFVGFLSNYEVYSYLKELKDSGSISQKNKSNRGTSTHMPTLIYETLKYFEDHNSPCLVQNKDIIFDFVQKIQPYKLTKAEKLTILNTRPTKPVDIQAIVEESEERLSEEQVNEIIAIVEDTLPQPEEPNKAVVKIEEDSE